MTPRRPRSLTLVDWGLLAAATAFGLYALRAGWGPGEVENTLGLLNTQRDWQARLQFGTKVEVAPVLGSQRLTDWLNRIHEILVALPTVLMPVTLALAVATFRRPRTLSRRARSGRGVVASGVSGVLVFAYLVNEGVTRRFPWLLRKNPPLQLATFTQYLARDVAFGILAAWVVMILTGRHRVRPDARERLGRLLGWAWLLQASDQYVLMWILY